MNTAIRKPLALVILDGWGYTNRREGNAIALAHTPNYDDICLKHPKTVLAASGPRVGLAEGAPGNSEVGHLSLGAGRVISTDIARISKAISGGAFFENPILKGAMDRAKASGAPVHLIGLLSDGDLHSSQVTLFAILRMARNAGLKDVFIHAILDGRDVPQRTADIYTEALEIKMADIGVGKLATLCGRYYAMDSDENWDRTARAYTMLVHAEGERAADSLTAIRASFLRGIADEFIQPIVLENPNGTPVAKVNSGDTVIFFNHRADGMRQLVKSLSVDDAAEFQSFNKPSVNTVCLTEYEFSFGLPTAFSQDPEPNVLAQVFAREGIANCRLTESEKYAHVTYFFNGGVEVEHPGEQRVLVQSPGRIAIEAQPESGCFKVTDKVLRALESGDNDVFIVNLAASDLVAHGGSLEKTIEAVQFIDTCLGAITDKVREMGGVTMITSDHGNCEQMTDPVTGTANPAHTTNPVPFHLIDDKASGTKLRDDGALEDVAPTILAVLGIAKPAEMTGRDLRQL
jgi:2,3-bisphosphoglycerate-independent phosphoglycerate mutase